MRQLQKYNCEEVSGRSDEYGCLLPQVGNETGTAEGNDEAELTVQPFRSLYYGKHGRMSDDRPSSLTLGFKRPYGSSSLGLKTLQYS